jgi:hypothetical protein
MRAVGVLAENRHLFRVGAAKNSAQLRSLNTAHLTLNYLLQIE